MGYRRATERRMDVELTSLVSNWRLATDVRGATTEQSSTCLILSCLCVAEQRPWCFSNIPPYRE